MIGRCLFKSLLGLMSLFVVAFALRNDIQNFVLSSPTSIELPNVESVTVTDENPHDRMQSWLSIINGTGKIPESQSNDPAELTVVWNAGNLSSQTRRNAQRLLNELERVTPDNNDFEKPDSVSLPEDFQFFNVWLEQRKLVEAERMLRAARRQNPDNVEQLRKQLAGVRKLLKDGTQDQVAGHAEFLRLEEAELRAHELRYLQPLQTEILLAPLAERGFEVLEDRAFDEVCQKLAARLDQLKGYTSAYGSMGSHATWIENETSHCEHVLRFVEAMRDADESKFEQRIRLLAQLHQAPDVHTSVRDLILLGTHRICERYLPNTVPLDEVVLSMEGAEIDAESLPVLRNDVVFVWQDKRLEWMIDSGYDEFTIPQKRLRSLIVTGTGTRPAFLKGTRKSEAAKTFNELRRQVDWTVESLQKLNQGCMPHSELLGEVWPRIEELNKRATEFPTVFVGVPSK